MDDGNLENKGGTGRWREDVQGQDFRDWLRSIHFDAVRHTEAIHRRQTFPHWVRG